MSGPAQAPSHASGELVLDAVDSCRISGDTESFGPDDAALSLPDFAAESPRPLAFWTSRGKPFMSSGEKYWLRGKQWFRSQRARTLMALEVLADLVRKGLLNPEWADPPPQFASQEVLLAAENSAEHFS